MTTSCYDVIVVGTGHAGCEAALAAARMGCKTAVFTLNLDNIALMPCNPSVGGPGKGHLVREIDALGGEIARNTDRTSIQIRLLNTSKGPAVQALRAQCDKRAYSQSMKYVLENEPNLTVKQAVVDDLIVDWEAGAPVAGGVITSLGARYLARTVVLTTGTFLKGRIIVGNESYPAGRAGEFPADNLSTSLADAGFHLGRLKTGTPPRVDARSIDFSLTEPQPGSLEPLFFSFDARNAYRDGRMASPSRLTPIADYSAFAPAFSLTPGPVNQLGAPPRPDMPVAPTLRSRGLGFGGEGWRDQLDCFVVQTNERTHDIIRANLDRAPMYNGGITSAGPRYCPSIETKIVRFAAKPSHQLFLEPEGWSTREIYVQGANTSLPEDVQLSMLRSIPALHNAEIMRAGYAIEYDYLPGTQVYPSLETKLMRNLFLAGQIIGTTGYEEAASLGIVAGINAARRARAQEAVVLRRDQAYIGVLIDDLVTKEMDEPYRMHTSQAEFRLLLRQDNADARLTPLAHELGLVSEERHAEIQRRIASTSEVIERMERTWIPPTAETNTILAAHGIDPIERHARASDFLCRGNVHVGLLQELGAVDPNLLDEVAREAETTVKYSGYVQRQEDEVARLRKLEGRTIPPTIDYAAMHGMRSESRERLSLVRPRTVGQASRVAGVAPSDISVLLVHLERQRRSKSIG